MQDSSPNIVLPARFRVLEALRGWIKTGMVQEGQPLPSERALCEQLGVGRSAVRSGLAMLAKEGLITDGDASGRDRLVKSTKSALSTASVLETTIAVLTPLPHPSPGHTQPGWVENLIQGTIHGVRASRHDVLVIHPERLKDGGLERLLSSPPCGVLIPEAGKAIDNLEAWVAGLRSTRIPVVVYGGSPSLTTFDRVISDHEGGSYDLTRWMIEHGRRRILNFWPKPGGLYWQLNRRKGYERAMQDAGIETLPTASFAELPWADDWSEQERWDASAHLMAGHLAPWLNRADPVDALLLANDGGVGIASAACQIMGKEPGRDLLIAGYDNTWAETPERQWDATPPAATVDKQNFEMGQEMVRLLLDRIAGRLPEAPQCRIVPSKLIVLAGDTAV